MHICNKNITTIMNHCGSGSVLLLSGALGEVWPSGPTDHGGRGRGLTRGPEWSGVCRGESRALPDLRPTLFQMEKASALSLLQKKPVYMRPNADTLLLVAHPSPG